MAATANTDPGDEPSVLAHIRPAPWTVGEELRFSDVSRLVDRALASCRRQERHLLDAEVPNAREAALWDATARGLSHARDTTAPHQEARVADLRSRCEAVLRDEAVLTEIRGALADGRAESFAHLDNVIFYQGTLWMRTGLSFGRLPPEAATTRRLREELEPLRQYLQTVDAAVQHGPQP